MIIWILISPLRASTKRGKSIHSGEKTNVDKKEVHKLNKVHKMEVFSIFFPVTYNDFLSEIGGEMKSVTEKENISLIYLLH